MLRDNPNESFAVYLLTSDDKYAVCGTDFFPNQLLCRKNSLWRRPFDHVPGNEKIKFHRYADTLWDEPCRLQTPPYDDTQGDVNRRENGRKLRKGTKKLVNEFFTNLPPKT